MIAERRSSRQGELSVTQAQLQDENERLKKLVVSLSASYLKTAVFVHELPRGAARYDQLQLMELGDRCSKLSRLPKIGDQAERVLKEVASAIYEKAFEIDRLVKHLRGRTRGEDGR